MDNEKQTDTSKDELMLVNRIYGLSSDYKPEDIVNIPTKYAYSNMKLRSSILEPLENLIDDTASEGYTFVVSMGYRTYKEQKSLYNSYAKSYGKSEADSFVARPGHSEYETGLSFDLEPYKYVKKVKDVKTSAEYQWLRDNAYRYGFIFRYITYCFSCFDNITVRVSKSGTSTSRGFDPLTSPTTPTNSSWFIIRSARL